VKQAPVNLRKPDTITFEDQTVPVDEIAAIHRDPVYFTYDVILSNYKHGGKSYSVSASHQSYQDVADLYDWRSYVWVEETDGAIIFHAHDSSALHVLEETLEQEHYAWVGTSTHIMVYRNQGNNVDALDREERLPDLIAMFATPRPQDLGFEV
jgi:hypothetical protein